MTTLLTRHIATGRPTGRVDAAPPEDLPAGGDGPRGFTDCRGEWHSLDEED